MSERGLDTRRDPASGVAREPWSPPPPSPAEAVAEAELSHAPEDRPRTRSVAWREQVGTVAAVGAGGFLGANARYLVGLWAVQAWGGAFPWGTLLINVAGAFVLGFYLTLVTERFAGRPSTRLFVATGILGAFTTFSTFSYETVHLALAGHAAAAFAYVSFSLLGGVAATVAGIMLAHAL